MIGEKDISMNMDMDEFSQTIIDQVHEKWRNLERYKQTKYGIWDCGFSVLYSPLRANADLMILGFNPGGDEKAFKVEDQIKVPRSHSYIPRDKQCDYPLAKKMRGLFEGKMHLLEESVKANLIPFRSPNKPAWYAIDPNLRTDLECFSRDIVQQLLERVQPRIVLMEGTQTFDLFCQWFKEKIIPGDENPLRGTRNRRLFCRARMIDERQVIGIIHLSGARPSMKDTETIKDELGKDLS